MSRSCLKYHDVPLELYRGIDISQNAIDEARQRFSGYKNADFIKSDFIEYLSNTNEKFDVKFKKSHRFHLEEKYFHSVLEEIKKKILLITSPSKK